ncbi:MAG TPA: DUF669 domain-containing protein [Dissulfurispiraceae bacterium]|nr:DUF669 domain-containing protein [Dissulfurispiraceae bacterium]
MANLGNFNADEYKDEYAPIPAGKYKAVITASEMKPSKSGGEYLALTVEIIEGAMKGRKVFGNLSLKNANPDAEKIAKIQLSNICRAVGITHPRDSSELHNKPLVVKLAVKPETDQYPAGNEVKAWEGVDGTPDMFQGHTHDVDTNAPASDGVTGTPRVGAPTTGSKKPWEK